LALVALAVAPAPAARAGGQGPFVPAAVHSDITLTFSFKAGDESESVTAKGAGDFNLGAPEPSARMHLDAGEEGSFDVIETGSVLYTREDNGRWEAEPVSDDAANAISGIGSLAGGIDFSGADPLQALRTLGVPVLSLPDETIRGMGVHHARVEINKEQFLRLVEQFGSPALGLGGLSPADIRELRDEIGDIRFSVDVWYGVDDNFPYRTASTLTVDFGIGSIDMAFTMDNLPLRERVEIAAPI
jgi:hypothetical protein